MDGDPAAGEVHRVVEPAQAGRAPARVAPHEPVGADRRDGGAATARGAVALLVPRGDVADEAQIATLVEEQELAGEVDLHPVGPAVGDLRRRRGGVGQRRLRGRAHLAGGLHAVQLLEGLHGEDRALPVDPVGGARVEVQLDEAALESGDLLALGTGDEALGLRLRLGGGRGGRCPRRGRGVPLDEGEGAVKGGRGRRGGRRLGQGRLPAGTGQPVGGTGHGDGSHDGGDAHPTSSVHVLHLLSRLVRPFDARDAGCVAPGVRSGASGQT